MKRLLLLSFLVISVASIAQPTVFGGKITDNNYHVYDMPQRGLVRALRLQGGTVTVTPIWEFASGSAASADYSTNWRPYFAGSVLSSYNKMIDPAVEAASARLNTAFGGQSGELPSVTNGNYYTIIVGMKTTDNYMSILETAYNPKTLTSSQSPVKGNVAPNQPVTVNVTLSAPLSSGERVFIRWTNNNDYTTATITEITNFGGTVNGSTVIPGQPANTTVSYYLLTSNKATFTNAEADYYTLNLDNNNGQANNYTYTADPALPVTLTDFSAYAKGGGVQVNWKVASENNISSYEVERSATGNSFEKKGSVIPVNSTAIHDYNYFDEQPVTGISFYRLKIIDGAGKATYSAVQKVNITKSNGTISVFPNPVVNSLTLSMRGLQKGVYQLLVTDQGGKAMMRKTIEMSGEGMSQMLQLPVLARGAYEVILEGNGSRYTQQLIRQ